ncbi:MAG: ABC transporter ATP-binding protein [Hyphomicrobiaceae bacterium]|nr:ABC transporter ATP-binding protein [Hyphomicrobiaceae bacterium]
MIQFKNVTKSYRLGQHRKVVLDRASFEIPTGRSMAVIGRNGAGKSSLLRLIAGSSLPDSGRIRRNGLRVSWPLGFAGSFHGALSGRENVRFACRIYGESIKAVSEYVEAFAELGEHFDMPVSTYSSGMKARLAFGLSMAMEFDVYLVDEITSVGDKIFRERCEEAFAHRRRIADVIMVSHSVSTIKKFCDFGCVLENGGIEFYDSVGDAVVAYEGKL